MYRDSVAAVTELSLLPATASEDCRVVAEVSDLVNRAYVVAEQGMWHTGVARTTFAETAEAIHQGELVVAYEDGRLVGSIRSRQLDERTGWFGALAVDVGQAGRGVGGKLVKFAEERALSAGATTMQLELLVPLQAHPHTDLLAAWYVRLGYREVKRCGLAEVEPAAVPFLAMPLEVAVMQRPLVTAR